MLVLISGCSFLVTGAPAAAPAPPDCVRSRFPPIADIGLAFAGLIGTEISAGLGELGADKTSDSGLAVFVPVLALSTISSIYGFVRTGQCREAYEARVGASIYAPPPTGGPSPAPPPPPFAPPPQ